MRSNKALDREIEAIAQAWNYGYHGDLHNKVASAVYYALRWARGRHETEPSVALRKNYGKESSK